MALQVRGLRCLVFALISMPQMHDTSRARPLTLPWLLLLQFNKHAAVLLVCLLVCTLATAKEMGIKGAQVNYRLPLDK
jgi:hypothetical protein